MKLFIGLFCLLISSCFSCAHFDVSGTKEYDLKDAYASVGRLTVTMKDGKGRAGATGFAIDDETVITAGHFCVHVYEAANKGLVSEKIDLTVVHGKVLLELPGVLEIKAMDEFLDICILKGDHGMLPLPFADFSKVEIGDKVDVLGAPWLIFPSHSAGRVSVPKYEISPGKYWMLLGGLHISPGYSGSPVLNQQGEVIGMIIAGIVPIIFMVGETPFALAQRGDVIQKFLKSVELSE